MDSNSVYQFFADQGETLGILFAAVLAGIAYLREQLKSGKEKNERRRTARYWIFYNASNRIRQDTAVLRYLTEAVDAEDFRATFTPREDEDAAENPFFSFADQSGADAAHDAMRQRLHKVFTGFSSTWQNDDMLLEKIVFEFSLLERTEQTRTLKYFSRYSTMQDQVSLLLPHTTASGDSIGLTPPQLAERSFNIYARMIEAMFLGYRLQFLVAHRVGAKNLENRMKELSKLMEDTAKNCVLPHELNIDLDALGVDKRAFDWVIRYRAENKGWLYRPDKLDARLIAWEGYTDETRAEKIAALTNASAVISEADAAPETPEPAAPEALGDTPAETATSEAEAPTTEADTAQPSDDAAPQTSNEDAADEPDGETSVGGDGDAEASGDDETPPSDDPPPIRTTILGRRD